MVEMGVTLPVSRVFEMAQYLGESMQICPARGHMCWADRGLAPYVVNGEEPPECVQCFLRAILNGD